MYMGCRTVFFSRSIVLYFSTCPIKNDFDLFSLKKSFSHTHTPPLHHPTTSSQTKMSKRRYQDVESTSKKICYSFRNWSDCFLLFQTPISEFLAYNWTHNDILDRFQIGKTCKSLRSLMIRAQPRLASWMYYESDIRSRYLFLRALASLK